MTVARGDSRLPYSCLHTAMKKTHLIDGCIRGFRGQTYSVDPAVFNAIPPARQCKTCIRRREGVLSLHAAAQRRIVRGIKRAIASHSSYYLWGPCAQDGKNINTRHWALFYDLTNYGSLSEYTTVEMESGRLIPNRRPDIVVTSPHGNKIIIEVVVSHDLDDDGVRDYRAAGIPTFLVTLNRRKSLDFSVQEGQAFATRVLNATHLCTLCQERKGIVRSRATVPFESRPTLFSSL